MATPTRCTQARALTGTSNTDPYGIVITFQTAAPFQSGIHRHLSARTLKTQYLPLSALSVVSSRGLCSGDTQCMVFSKAVPVQWGGAEMCAFHLSEGETPVEA